MSGYTDPSGAVVIAPRFYFAEAFSEGLALVSVGKSMAFIDEKGTVKQAHGSVKLDQLAKGQWWWD